MDRPQVICLTPIKNEAWILDRFLQCSSIWADVIILADQKSEDSSIAIAERYPKVRIVNNDSDYGERARQQLLIAEARKLEGPRLLVTLDADEFLSANFMTSAEWKTALAASPGTNIRFQRADVMPDMESYVLDTFDYAWGFMDDGSEHVGWGIHSPRLPIPAHASSIRLREIKVLHYQSVDWDRLKSKNRWYQCWERIHKPGKSVVDLYRQYHYMDRGKERKISCLPRSWLEGYIEKGIDMTSVNQDSHYWWDREVLEMFIEHGVDSFRKVAVWDVDWAALIERKYPEFADAEIGDPRNGLDRFVHRVLGKSQRDFKYRWRKLVDGFLKRSGWE